MTPAGLPRPDPDGVERVRLTVFGDAKEVDPKSCANAVLDVKRCIRYDTGEDRRAECFWGHTVEQLSV